MPLSALQDEVKMVLDMEQQRDGNSKVLHEAATLKQKMVYNASGLPTYIGLAKAGTATSAAGWQIRKLTYTGNNVTAVDFADGDNNFDNVWDNYATGSYS